MILVLDAGALIAVDRGDREVASRLRSALAAGHAVHVPAGVIGQAWRNPSRQALLSRMLKGCQELVLDGSAARAAGRLCGETGTDDVIDASVALAVAEASDTSSDVVLPTSDTRDLGALLAALSIGVRMVSV
jgi:hypothetical protein